MCAYNEIDRIQPALEDVYSSLDGRTNSCEIIILDNGSDDGTREWLQGLKLPEVRVFFNEANLGKGGSIKLGIAASTGRHVVIHDPDMEYKAADVWELLNTAREENAQLVLGSRMLGGENISYHYRANYVGVMFLAGCINLLYGSRLTDPATAMKMLEGDFARSLKLRSTGFDLDFEIVVRALRLGHKIVEKRVRYIPRTRAEGKKLRAWRDGFLSLRVILRDRILRSRSFVTPSEPMARSGE